MEFGHSEGFFTLKKFLVYFVKVPSELRNSQRGARESRFVFWTRLAAGESNQCDNPQFFFSAIHFGPKRLGKAVCPGRLGLALHPTGYSSIWWKVCC